MKDKEIRMGNPDSAIGRRIKEVAEAAEAEYRTKLEKSRDPDIDVRDFFTDEELERLLSENEMFEGHLADWTALQRYNKLTAAACWLDAHSIECLGVEIEGTAPSRPNATVALDIRRLASLRGKELKAYAGDGTYGDRLNKTELLEQSVEEEFVWMPMDAWSSDTGIFISKK